MIAALVVLAWLLFGSIGPWTFVATVLSCSICI